MSKTLVFQVTLIYIPGPTSVVNLSEPVTIAQAIAADGQNPAEWAAQINGQEVSNDTKVTDVTGTIRLIKSAVKGN
jgi:hypothetical protein